MCVWGGGGGAASWTSTGYRQQQNRKQRCLLAFKKTNQNTQEVKRLLTAHGHSTNHMREHIWSEVAEG